MERTFRICKHGYLLEWCKPHCTPVSCESCESYKPRETPLLVDELAEVLEHIAKYAQVILNVHPPGWQICVEDIRERADTAWKHYKEEVGDE